MSLSPDLKKRADAIRRLYEAASVKGNEHAHDILHAGGPVSDETLLIIAIAHGAKLIRELLEDTNP